MSYLLSGSLAYDSILLHKGKFHARILPESLSRLNVSFGIQENNQEFGGTGGNIAYNASLLGDNPFLCMTIGSDGQEYLDHLKNCGIDISNITQVQEAKTAHAWIMTDQENNQITGFYKGAMRKMPNVAEHAKKLKFWHLAPEDVGNTARLVKLAQKEKIKYFFDPGQCLAPFLEGHAESIIPFKKIVSGATGIFVNEYESQLLQEKTDKTLNELINPKTKFIIETLGSNGLIVHTSKGQKHLPVAKPKKIVDPTGCGDSLRAGFAHGYAQGWDIEKCAQLGVIMGSFAIEESGGQNHTPTYEDISKRLHETFGWFLPFKNGEKNKNKP